MAIYHLRTRSISRKSGKTAIAAAAYRAGTSLKDELLNQTADYRGKAWQVVHSEINLPAHAPAEYADRATLWNSAEKAEKNNNARVAREVEIAIPIEWSADQSIEILREFIQENFVSKGMCADWNIHDKGDGNPHCHVLLTTRPIDKNGEWTVKEKKVYKLDQDGNKIPIIDPKTGQQKIGPNNRKMWQRERVIDNSWNSRKTLKSWRKEWELTANKYLDKDHQISSESYKTLGIDKEPTIHEGYVARAMEARGLTSERCEHNRAVKERNSLREQIRVLGQELYSSLKAKLDSYVDYFQSGIKHLKEAFELPEPKPLTAGELAYLYDYLDIAEEEPTQQPTIDPSATKNEPNKPTYQPDPYTYPLEDETRATEPKNDDLEDDYDIRKELEMIDRYLPFNKMTEEEVLNHFEEVGVVEVAYCKDRWGDFLKLLDSAGNVRETELAKDKIGHLFQEENWYFTIADLRDEIVAQQKEQDRGWER